MFFFCEVSRDLYVGNFPIQRYFVQDWNLTRCLFDITWRKWRFPAASSTLLARFGQLQWRQASANVGYTWRRSSIVVVSQSSLSSCLRVLPKNGRKVSYLRLRPSSWTSSPVWYLLFGCNRQETDIRIKRGRKFRRQEDEVGSGDQSKHWILST